MAKLTNGDFQAPFWGATNDYSTGRDPLGFQTTSLSTYATLIPGITNLSSRIRYYGFYCWILYEYGKRIRNISHKKQYHFIRRAEYQLALLMVNGNPKLTKVPGNTYATNYLATEPNDDLDIASGADKKAQENTYWKGDSGAFGQYYAGVLQQLGLIIIREKDSSIFICTNEEFNEEFNGIGMATAFMDSISQDSRELFIANIESGLLKKSDAKELFEAFSIVNIAKNSSEWNYYIKLLKINDSPLQSPTTESKYFRNQSAKLLLQHIKNKPKSDWTNFKNDIYELGIKNSIESLTTIQKGWYYYQLNEYWHYSIELIFNSVLTYLDQKAQHPMISFTNSYIETLFDEKKSTLNMIKTSTLDSLILTQYDKNTTTHSYTLSLFKSSSQTWDNAWNGFILLFRLYFENKGILNDLMAFAQLHNIEREGDCISGLKRLEKYFKYDIKEFMTRYIQNEIINRHILVAYHKMGTGVKNTLKFSYEDNYLAHIETIEPVWTTPRIYSLHMILEDLGLISINNNSKTYTLSNEGINFLDN